MSIKSYASNTLAGASNQAIRGSEEQKKRKSYIFYKIQAGGSFEYTLLFSSVTDGTSRMGFAPNTVCDSWEILSARVGRLSEFPEGDVEQLIPHKDFFPEDFKSLTFDGKAGYAPSGAEIFKCDPITLEFKKGEYLCLELETLATYFPCHPELWIASYVFEDGRWSYSPETPLAIMIGCRRYRSRGRIAFLGDSITQGIGPRKNGYENWCARLAEHLGDRFTYYNLGIGYGCAKDVAEGGVWLERAKTADIVFLCFGVNDIEAGRSADEIIGDLKKIIDSLKSAGCRVILQTVPPFNQTGARLEIFKIVNAAIKGELANIADLVFDCTWILSQGERSNNIAHFGGHPNAEGSGIWAEKLYRFVNSYLQNV